MIEGVFGQKDERVENWCKGKYTLGIFVDSRASSAKGASDASRGPGPRASDSTDDLLLQGRVRLFSVVPLEETRSCSLSSEGKAKPLRRISP